MSSATKPRDLEDVFALRIADNHQFRSWLLSRTKFAKLWPLARLLDKEQAAQAAGDWWRNWSAGSPSDGGVFLGFELDQTRLRFGVFVASAIEAGDLHAAEAQRRSACAEVLSHDDHFLNLMDFETVLLAPQALILEDKRTLAFDRRIPFETVAGFVPQFGAPIFVARQEIAA